MDDLKAPQQNQILGKIAEILQMAEQNRSAEFLPSSLNVFGLFSDLLLPSSRTVEKMSYGDPLFRMPQQSRIPITADREYLADVAGMLPLGAPAARPSARAMQDIVRQIQTEPPTGAISPEIAAKVIPETKVVDEKGLPKLMYHGTTKSFDDFKLSRRNAIFVSSDPNFVDYYAGGFTDGYKPGGNIRPVYVDAKNIFDYENKNHIKKIVENGENIGPFLDGIKEGWWASIENPRVQDAIKKSGFDSFFVQEHGIKNLGVFDSKQIKSALSDPVFEDIFSNPLMQDSTR